MQPLPCEVSRFKLNDCSKYSMETVTILHAKIQDSKNLLVNMHHYYSPTVHNLNSKYQHKIHKINRQLHVFLNSLPTIMNNDQMRCRLVGQVAFLL